MGEVFLAEQQQIRTRVAIKMLLAKISENKDIVQRFFNEAIAVSKIQHSGIVRIFDVGFHGQTGRAYLVMEFLDGETLSSRIEKGAMTIPEIADVGRQIASVLDAVNKAGITHRDLKPDNIFLVPDAELPRGERIKILDFGIAKLTGAGVGMTSTSASSMGTPLYMSPEQWMSSAKVDWRADAYSLGCVAFEMITGRPPFTGESIGALCAHHLNSPPPHPSQFAQVPPQLDALVTRLLAKNPDERPSSMREIAAVFTSLDGAAPSAAYSTPMSPPVSAGMTAAAAANTTLGSAASMVTAEKPRKSRVVPIVAAIVAAAGLGTGVFLVMANKSSSEPPPAAPAVAIIEAGAPAPPPPAAAPVVAVDAAVAVVVPTDAVVVEAVMPVPTETKPDAKKPPVTPKKPPAKVEKPPPPPLPEPPPPPAVDPDLPAKITRPMIKSVIAKLKTRIDVCRSKSLNAGSVLVKVDVLPDGSVGDVVFQRTPDEGVSKCVLAKLHAFGKFPATQTGGSWKALFDVPGRYVGGNDVDEPPVAPKKH